MIALTAVLSSFEGIDNYNYAIIVVALYLLVNIFYFYKYKSNDILCFELLFAISFLLCTFLVVFTIPLLDKYQLGFFITNENIIRKSYQYGFLGYLFYMLGLIRVGNEEVSSVCNAPKTAYILSNLLCTFFLILFFLAGGIRLLYIYSDQNIDIDNRLEKWGEFLSYAIIAFTISIPLNFRRTGTFKNLYNFISKLSPLFLINFAILITMLLISGYRSQAFKIIIPLIIAFSIQIRSFKVWEILSILVIGAILMLFIGSTRSGGNFNFAQIGFLDSIKDFIPANAAIGFLVEYTDTHGCTYGSNFFVRIFSFIPFLQGIVMSFIPDGVLAPASSTLFTENANLARGGMGTNLIGDMYYSFSIVGVLTMMYLLGYVCRRVRKLRTPYIWALFLNFVGNALFLPRGELVSIWRSMAIGAILMFFILKLSSNLSRRYSL